MKREKFRYNVEKQKSALFAESQYGYMSDWYNSVSKYVNEHKHFFTGEIDSVALEKANVILKGFAAELRNKGVRVELDKDSPTGEELQLALEFMYNNYPGFYDDYWNVVTKIYNNIGFKHYDNPNIVSVCCPYRDKEFCPNGCDMTRTEYDNWNGLCAHCG